MIQFKKSETVIPYPNIVYTSFVFVLVIVGVIVSVYLSISHYRVHTDIGYSSFCAISKAINCDTVSQSPYSIFWNVPVPIWGVIGYLFFLITLLFSFDIKTKQISLYSTLLGISLLFSVVSIILAMITSFKIHSYCMMCILTYAINFMLVFMIWLTKKRLKKKTWTELCKKEISFWISNRIRAALYYLPFLMLTVLIIFWIPNYWEHTMAYHGSKSLPSGITDDGDPWIGAVTPELTIIEYADYLCFQCKKMHFILRSLAAEYPNKIRIVHRHFPMDKKFNPLLKENLHPGSGILSSIAIYASNKNKFWEMNDYLYQYKINNNAILLRTIAEETGLDLKTMKTGIHDPEIIQKLQKDIVSGWKHNISGTPTYLINDQIYIGQIPAKILDSVRK